MRNAPCRIERSLALPAMRTLAVFAVVAGIAASPVEGRQAGTENGEWRFWGGDAQSTRYSPLD